MKIIVAYHNQFFTQMKFYRELTSKLISLGSVGRTLLRWRFVDLFSRSILGARNLSSSGIIRITTSSTMAMAGLKTSDDA